MLDSSIILTVTCVFSNMLIMLGCELQWTNRSLKT